MFMLSYDVLLLIIFILDRRSWKIFDYDCVYECRAHEIRPKERASNLSN